MWYIVKHLYIVNFVFGSIFCLSYILMLSNTHIEQAIIYAHLVNAWFNVEVQQNS